MGATVVSTSRFGKSEMDRESARSGPRTAGALPDDVTNWPHKEDGVMMAACRTSFTWTFSGRAEFVSQLRLHHASEDEEARLLCV